MLDYIKRNILGVHLQIFTSFYLRFINLVTSFTEVKFAANVPRPNSFFSSSVFFKPLLAVPKIV